MANEALHFGEILPLTTCPSRPPETETETEVNPVIAVGIELPD